MTRALVVIAMVAACTGEPATPDAGVPSDVPVACDGHLCATTNGSGCEVGRGAGLIVVAVALLAMRKKKQGLGLALGLGLVIVGGVARADEGVDVHVAPEVEPAHRLSISWHPLPAITGAGKLELDATLVPIDHHALVVNGFYTTTATAPIVVFDNAGNPMQLPEQKFSGLGFEVGYRYYSGRGGPRGWFIGPSLIMAFMHEKQGRFGDGSSFSYVDIGGAVDAGYSAIIGNVVLALGLGVQALQTSTPIPPQQFPASIYGNSGVVPRFVFSLGWAF